MSKGDEKASRQTRAVQGLHYIDQATGAVVPGIETSTTFSRDANYRIVGDYTYSRYGSPTVAQVEKLLAELDGGAGALLFAAGMAAVASLFETVPTGRHIVAPRIMYHGAQDWLRRISERRNIGLTLFDQTEGTALEKALRPGETTLVWIETPVNPTWDVIDIEKAAGLSHAAGARLAVDSTVAPPCTTRALELGADIVFHSATKYLGGHSDLTAGVLVCREKDEQWEEIAQIRKLTGGIAAPFEAWLLMRGIRTLFVRYERASKNAELIARHFADHPKITRVLYPGLQNHPGHEIARRQMTGGFGGMMSLLINGGEDEARRIASAVKLFVPATSLGGVESLIEHRKTVEGPHSAVPPNLLRLSIGLEDADDLIADLEQALGQI